MTPNPQNGNRKNGRICIKHKHKNISVIKKVSHVAESQNVTVACLWPLICGPINGCAIVALVKSNST